MYLGERLTPSFISVAGFASRVSPRVSTWIHTNAVFTDAICRIPYLRYYGICCSQAIRITDFTRAFPHAESTSTLGLARKIECGTFRSASFSVRFNLIISLPHPTPPLLLCRHCFANETEPACSIEIQANSLVHSTNLHIVSSTR